jgi:hypothetical protein
MTTGTEPATATTNSVNRSNNRPSRFIEQPMQEYTPANSVFEAEDDENEYQSRGVMWAILRVLNAGLHATACVVLLAIMTNFLANAGWWRLTRYAMTFISWNPARR